MTIGRDGYARQCACMVAKRDIIRAGHIGTRSGAACDIIAALDAASGIIAVGGILPTLDVDARLAAKGDIVKARDIAARFPPDGGIAAAGNDIARSCADGGIIHPVHKAYNAVNIAPRLISQSGIIDPFDGLAGLGANSRVGVAVDIGACVIADSDARSARIGRPAACILADRDGPVGERLCAIADGYRARPFIGASACAGIITDGDGARAKGFCRIAHRNRADARGLAVGADGDAVALSGCFRIFTDRNRAVPGRLRPGTADDLHARCKRGGGLLRRDGRAGCSVGAYNIFGLRLCSVGAHGKGRNDNEAGTAQLGNHFQIAARCTMRRRTMSSNHNNLSRKARIT